MGVSRLQPPCLVVPSCQPCRSLGLGGLSLLYASYSLPCYPQGNLGTPRALSNPPPPHQTQPGHPHSLALHGGNDPRPQARIRAPVLTKPEAGKEHGEPAHNVVAQGLVSTALAPASRSPVSRLHWLGFKGA